MTGCAIWDLVGVVDVLVVCFSVLFWKLRVCERSRSADACTTHS